MVDKKLINKPLMIQQLRYLGVQRNSLLVVHTSFSRVGPLEGGPLGLILALQEVLGPGGTLVMPSMTSDDDHPFDPMITPCPDMGITAETFWRCPGVRRSANPHAFAAFGPLAHQITAPHPLDPPHGLNSPVGRAYELDAQVLLLGVGHDANTTIHLAENLAGVRYRRAASLTILENGNPVRFEYQEIDHCCQNFALTDGWLDRSKLQRRGIVGNGEARLARSRDIVRLVTERLIADETVFLHPRGFDTECDEAWSSLPANSSPA